MDYVLAKLREELVREGLRLGKDGESPLIEVKVLACWPIAFVSTSLGPTEETIASVTLKDPESGLVVGTAICIGRTSSSVVQDRSRTNMPAPTPRTPLRRPAKGVAPAKVSIGFRLRPSVLARQSVPGRWERGAFMAHFRRREKWKNLG